MSDLEYLTLQFYGWWQLVTCGFAFLALMAIWYHLGKRKKDYAQLWLAFSVLCWSITGLIEVIYAVRLQESTGQEAYVTKATFQLSGYSSLLSLGNSFFILLSLPWFKHIPPLIKPIIQSRYWNFIVGLPFLFSLLPTVSKIFMSESYGLISELDVYYSILTLGFLGLILWESFDKRRLKLLAWLSLLCILITFTAQIYKLTGNEINMRLFSAIFKSTLIMIFFALAMSWVKDLSEHLSPITNALKIRLKNDIAVLEGITEKEQAEISLSNASMELLRKFVSARISDNGWLEIKPKHEKRAGKAYDIRDHNEIKRLTHSILDGVYGKQNWTKEQHEVPFKEAFYETPENENRKIRLKILPENCSIS